MGKPKQWKRQVSLTDWDVVLMPRVRPAPGWEVYFGKERVGEAGGDEATAAEGAAQTKATAYAA